MKTPLRLSVLFATVALSTTVFEPASRAADDPFGGAAPVSNATLQASRGGFTADGLTFGFGATLQTLVNGQVALTTTLTLLNNGAVTQNTTVNQNILANDSPGAGGGGSTVIPVNGAASLAAALAGTGVDVGGLSANGVVIKSDTGVTAVLDDVTPNQLENLVINTADGQRIVQNTTITISLPAAEMAGMQASGMMNSLANAVQTAQIPH